MKRKYANTTEREFYKKKRIIKIIKGLLVIAEIAMPDTYFATDSRVRSAKKLLKEWGE